jgi:hypothetical protein
LIHAAIRHLILNDPEKKWPGEFGLPINQEDLAGTLMVFSWIILDGLDRLGVQLTAQQKQGYLEIWRVLGRLMGVREELIPSDVPMARDLCNRIQDRQVEICPEGKAMAQALLHLMEQRIPPGPWRSWPTSLMRHFLPPAVADGFEIQGNSLDESLMEHAAQFWVEHGTDRQPADLKPGIVRKFGLVFVQSYVDVELRGQGSPFILPTTLHYGWAKSHMPSLWEQLKRK